MKQTLIKKRTKRKILRTAVVAIVVLTVYGAPFTATYATEPEQVKAKNGRVITW